MTHSIAPGSDLSTRQRHPLDGVATESLPAAERLIVALDFPTGKQALDLIDGLDGATRWYKVGLELYIAEGNALIDEIHRRGFSVFLDLKLHDIPNTVAAAIVSVGRLGVSMLTVHAAGGPEMLVAAANAAGADGPTLLAVTVLTSMDTPQLEATGISSGAKSQVERLANLAIECGVPGLVCSANEAFGLRQKLGSKPLLVIPGIRPQGSAIGDQKRVATPGAAIAAGASYLVVGRPITRAADPGLAVRAILAEMEN